MKALAIVCCDGGMSSQFERFKNRNEVAFTYRVLLKDGQNPFTNKAVPPELLVSPIKEGKNLFVDIESDRYLSFKSLDSICENLIENENVNLFQLRFPDPLNPNVDEVTISIEPTLTDN